jgi:hypothetical protein
MSFLDAAFLAQSQKKKKKKKMKKHTHMAISVNYASEFKKSFGHVSLAKLCKIQTKFPGESRKITASHKAQISLCEEMTEAEKNCKARQR